MKLLITESAAQQVERAIRWWLENRDASELFEAEFKDALNRLMRAPHIGSVIDAPELGPVRAMRLHRTRYLLVYRVDGHAAVVVLALRHMSRGPR